MKLPSKAFLLDAGERVVLAFITAFIGVLTVTDTTPVTMTTLHQAEVAGLAAALAAVKVIVAGLIPGSLSPASLVRTGKRKAAQVHSLLVTMTTQDTMILYIDGKPEAVGELRSPAVRRTIPERKVTGKPLGRHVHHDPRSLDYLVEPDGTVASVTWPRHIPILNQGDIGSCTGNAATGLLGSSPLYETLAPSVQASLNEKFAVAFYSQEEKADGGAGYPPEDEGSSGLTAGKVAKADGYIAGYTHITSVAAALTAIQRGPFIVGSDWYDGMDNPDANGLVEATGDVRGGHEYLCRQYDAVNDLWWMDNSWGADDYGVKGRFCYSSATFSKLLAAQGDATCFQPLADPAPTPTPSPAPGSTVVVDDPALVAHINGLAARKSEPAHDYLQARLETLWKV